MKRLAILFLALVIAFGAVWVSKMNSPKNRPNSYAAGLNGNYWWNAVADTAEVNPNWKLSSGVPGNYVPVPGRNGLYMVVDDEGYIIGYKAGERDENGNWVWKDVDPNIPENYEAVPGLENVYKVTADDGTVTYFKYVRNKDDTYAFVEVDAKGNMLGQEEPKGNEVPSNYERVNKNQYAVKNKDGVTIAYKERKTDPKSDTGYTWVNINEPDVKETETLTGFDGGSMQSSTLDPTQTGGSGGSMQNPSLDLTMPDIENAGTSSQNQSQLGIDGGGKTTSLDPSLTEFNLTTDVTGKGDVTGGTRPYAGYTNTGTGESAIPTINPPETLITADSIATQGQFVFMNPVTTVVDTQHYNTETVLITAPPSMTGSNFQVPSGSMQIVTDGNGMQMQAMPTMAPMTGWDNTTVNMSTNMNQEINQTITEAQTGTYKSSETTRFQEQDGSDIVTYEQTVTMTYSATGELLATEKSDKKEISRQKATVSASTLEDRKSSLGEEQSRIVDLMFDAGGEFSEKVPNEMVRLLNEARVSNGIPSVTFSGSSTAYKLALCRASMMALTKSGNKNLKAYGTLGDMCSMYGIRTSSPSENMLMINAASADSIHNLLQGSAYASRMSESYTQVAIAIVVKDGVYYIDEIFLE